MEGGLRKGSLSRCQKMQLREEPFLVAAGGGAVARLPFSPPVPTDRPPLGFPR